MMDHAGTGETNVERYNYFMVRLSASDADPQHFSGLIERLGSGEKRAFADQAELLHLFASWSVASANMPLRRTLRNGPDELKSPTAKVPHNIQGGT
jgi:hypothetical protein